MDDNREGKTFVFRPILVSFAQPSDASFSFNCKRKESEIRINTAEYYNRI